jgi:hypothetical protein
MQAIGGLVGGWVGRGVGRGVGGLVGAGVGRPGADAKRIRVRKSYTTHKKKVTSQKDRHASYIERRGNAEVVPVDILVSKPLVISIFRLPFSFPLPAPSPSPSSLPHTPLAHSNCPSLQMIRSVNGRYCVSNDVNGVP